MSQTSKSCNGGGKWVILGRIGLVVGGGSGSNNHNTTTTTFTVATTTTTKNERLWVVVDDSGQWRVVEGGWRVVGSSVRQSVVVGASG